MEVDDDGLDGRHARRQHQAAVVAVHHDQHADRPRGQAPAVLPHQLPLYASAPRGAPTARVGLVGNAEHLGEVLAEAVRGGGLHRAAVRGDERLDGGRVEPSREFLLLRFAAFNHGNRQQLFVHPRVVVQDLQHLLLRLLLRRERAVALLPLGGIPRFYLPEELARADERRRVLELPADDVRPLVQTQREVAVAADPSGIRW